MYVPTSIRTLYWGLIRLGSTFTYGVRSITPGKLFWNWNVRHILTYNKVEKAILKKAILSTNSFKFHKQQTRQTRKNYQCFVWKEMELNGRKKGTSEEIIITFVDHSELGFQDPKIPWATGMLWLLRLYATYSINLRIGPYRTLIPLTHNTRLIPISRGFHGRHFRIRGVMFPSHRIELNYKNCAMLPECPVLIYLRLKAQYFCNLQMHWACKRVTYIIGNVTHDQRTWQKATKIKRWSFNKEPF